MADGDEYMVDHQQSASDQDIEYEQTRRFCTAVGHGLPSTDIGQLQQFLSDAKPFKVYEVHSKISFMYVMLDKEGWRPLVRKAADVWIEDESNIRRAAQEVGRPVQARTSLLRGFCVFRMKAFDGHGWTKMGDSLGIDECQPQTVVFIALEDLDSSNGVFMVLKRGSDVCLDSGAEIQVPVNGGGGWGIDRLTEAVCLVESIIDIAGAEQYNSLREQCMRQADGFLLVFSVNSPASLDELSVLRQRITQIKHGDSRTLIVLVGNKVDTETDHQAFDSRAMIAWEDWGGIT